MNSLAKVKTALLVVDMQNGVVANAHEREKVIANINDLVSRARAQNVPVIWVQHANEELVVDSEPWKIVSEFAPHKEDYFIRKQHGDTFEETNLSSILESQKIRRLVVTGAQTEACIRATIHGSFVRGYDTTLVGDAHTTEDMTAYGLPKPEALIALTNIYWKWQTGPGREARVEKAKEVVF